MRSSETARRLFSSKADLGVLTSLDAIAEADADAVVDLSRLADDEPSIAAADALGRDLLLLVYLRPSASEDDDEQAIRFCAEFVFASSPRG